MRTLLLLGLLAAIARAVDVSGTYTDEGTIASSATDTPLGSVPLRGLLGLEFDLPLARLNYGDTDRVVITQKDDYLVIRCLDRAGAETWSAHWDRGATYGTDDGQVKLVLRAKRFEHDGFLFVLSPTGAGQLLQVEVLKVQTTCLGPVGKPIGTFLFARIEPSRLPGGQ